MILSIIIFIVSLTALIYSAKYFNQAAEIFGSWLKLPPFVIGVFIIGIGTSLPELVSGVLSVNKGLSEILSGNIIGANISNLLLITGLAVIINKKNIDISSSYLFIDLHFLLGSVVYFYIIAYDGQIIFSEAFIGILLFIVYASYLIKGGKEENFTSTSKNDTKTFPAKSFIILLVAAAGIYFSAEYTVSSLNNIAVGLNIPQSIIALTILSIGTSLPELAVNINAIKNGKAEMAVGNVLGSCIFNTLIIPTIGSLFGTITVGDNLLSFSLPLMAAASLLFYLLTHDKKISVWEGLLFVILYILFIVKTITN